LRESGLAAQVVWQDKLGIYSSAAVCMDDSGCDLFEDAVFLAQILLAKTWLLVCLLYTAGMDSSVRRRIL